METVLVATGDGSFGARFGRALAEMGYHVLSAATPAEALRQVQEPEVHVLVADAALGMAETADLLSRVHRRRPEVPALVAGEPATLRKLPPPVLERAFHLIPSEPTADRLGEAVARAVAQNRQYREDSRRLRQLEKLKESAMELANMVRWDELGKFLQDHEAFSRKLIDLIALTLEVERVSLMLIDEKTQRMRIAYAKGVDEEVRRSVSTKVGEGISGWVAKEGEPLLIKDIARETTRGESQFQQNYRNRSLMCVPLKVNGKTLGVLNANNKVTGEPFTEQDLALFTTFTCLAALSFANAQLFEKLAASVDELAKTNKKLVRTNLSLAAKMTELNTLKGEARG
jgi:DNA-binding NarL/FixJ family response regulator